VPEAVTWAGWRPVFADIAPGTVNMTSETLAACVQEDAQAVILTHQFGLPTVVEPIVGLCRRLGLFVIEDAAAALGASYRGRPVGTFGDASVISFHLTKVANAGHAGVLLTNNDLVAERVQSLWSPGESMAKGAADFCKAAAWWVAMQPHCYPVLRRLRRILYEDPLYEVVVPNLKPPTDSFISCSRFVSQLASTQVARLASIVAARRGAARIYVERLSGHGNGIRVCPVPDGAEPAWTQFPVFVERKEECYRFFLEHGVDLSWTFRYSCAASYGTSRAPNSERAARTLLGLPTYPGLAPEEARRICDLFHMFLLN
jgi:dTDP-4-amino-4,6-dideoxygalactose transaminase